MFANTTFYFYVKDAQMFFCKLPYTSCTLLHMLITFAYPVIETQPFMNIHDLLCTTMNIHDSV